MPITVRGSATVLWKPPWTLTLTSPDGLDLDADGESHPLQVRLLHTVTGLPIANRQVLLETDPRGRIGDKAIKWTDANGRCTFNVSSETDESVLYRAAVMTASNIEDTLTIQWGEEPEPIIASGQAISAPLAVTMNVTAAYSDDCTMGRISIVAVTCGLGFSQVITSVTDSLGTVYTLVQSATAAGANIVSVYKGIIPADGANTITATVTSDGTAPSGYGAGIVAAEYGRDTVSATDPPISASQSRTNSFGATATAGQLAAGQIDGTIYLGVFRTPKSFGPIVVGRTYATGFNERVALSGSSSGIGTANYLSIADSLGETIVGIVEPSLTWVLTSGGPVSRTDETVALALE